MPIDRILERFIVVIDHLLQTVFHEKSSIRTYTMHNNAGRKCKAKTNLVSACGKPNLGEYAAELRY